MRLQTYGSDPYDPKNLNESIGPATRLTQKLRDVPKKRLTRMEMYLLKRLITPGLTDATRKTLTEQGFKPSTPMPVIGSTGVTKMLILWLVVLVTLHRPTSRSCWIF